LAYQVLARRWRPQRFAEVVGQDHVTRTLANAIKTGRLAHAFLFCGPRGVGKTTTARILAKCLNCETASGGPVPDPCNECTACLEINEGRSLDVLEIDGASNRGIDEIRDLRENVRYAPSAGRVKVYIIDEVHMLTKEAFNALLKTLEEPPPNVYFVFATTEIHKVPATIRSRCQKYDFHRIGAPLIADTLAELARKEGLTVEPEALQEIARQADGGLRDATSLLDQAAAVGRGSVTLETLRELLGEAEDEAYLALAEHLARSEALPALTKLQELLERGIDPARVAVSLTQTFRDLFVARAASDGAAALGVRPDLIDEFRRVARTVSEEKLTALLAIASRTVADLRRSTRPRLTLEVALARMSRLADPGEMAALLERLESLEGRLGGDSAAGREADSPSSVQGGPPGSPPRPPAARRAAPRRGADSRRAPRTEGAAEDSAGEAPTATATLRQDLDPETGRVWSALLDRVRGRKMTLASFLEHGDPEVLTAEGLCALFANSYHEGMVGRRENIAIIQEELARIVGRTVPFRVRSGAPLGSERRERTPASESPPATGGERRGLLQENPGLSRIIHDLGGQLLPGGGSEPGGGA
jgi:DNA polymerase-3 subunit gamma/tau